MNNDSLKYAGIFAGIDIILWAGSLTLRYLYNLSPDITIPLFLCPIAAGLISVLFFGDWIVERLKHHFHKEGE